MTLSQKNILVTGGCGYIGSHVCRQLSEVGANVTVVDNLSTGFADALINNETLIKGDVGDRKLLDQVMSSAKFDAIIHFAASLIVEESVSDPLKYYENNVANSLVLLKAAAHHKLTRFIFSSTAAVYGDDAVVPVKEADKCWPASPYGWSKLMIERMIQDIAPVSSINYGILRYFNVAGGDPEGRMGLRSPNATHLIKLAAEAAVGKRSKLTIFGDDYKTRDGTCVRDYIHVEDLASAHLSTLTYLLNGGTSQILNCGYGDGFTVKEVIDAFKSANGINFTVEQGARRPGDVGEVIADVSKIQSTLDWVPKYQSINQIVQDAYNWEQILAKRS